VAAIDQAQARAELLRQTDLTLGEMQREEVIRLEKVLGILMPELNVPTNQVEMRQ
jgi:hypothetical protein